MDQQKYIDTMIKGVKEKSGKPVKYWVEVINNCGLEKHGQIMKMLKTDHGFTHGYANMLVHYAKESLTATSQNVTGLVDTQYKGKENLRKIYDEILKHVNKFGDELEVSPKKAYVSLRAKKQFALVQPSTKTRIDVGLNLKGEQTNDRLEAAGSFNSMCTHRVRLTERSQVDKELVNWLKMAFERAK